MKEFILKALKEKRALSVLLAAAMLVSGMVPSGKLNTVYAAENDYDYLLTVGTGSKDAAGKVTGFRIRYTAAHHSINNIEYEYTLTAEDDFRSSMEQLISACSSSCKPDARFAKSAVSADSMAYYLVSFPVEVKEIKGIDVIFESAGSWICNEFTLAKLDSVESVYKAGKSDIYVKSKGEKLLTLETEDSDDGYPQAIFNVNSGGFYEMPLEKVTDSDKPYDDTKTDSTETFMARIDIADVYGAGFEYLTSLMVDNMTLDGYANYVSSVDPLVLKIQYKTKSGTAKTTEYPILSETCKWLKDRGIDGSTKMYGLIEQGDTLAFPVQLPQYKELIGYTIAYNYSDCSRKMKSDAQNLGWLGETGSDSISVAGLSLYSVESETDLPSAQISNGFVRYDFGNSPLYYYCADTYQGMTLHPNQVTPFNVGRGGMQPYEGGALLPELSSLYMVEIHTDNIDGAKATSDAAGVLAYESFEGKKVNVDIPSLAEAGESYYGMYAGNYKIMSYGGGSAREIPQKIDSPISKTMDIVNYMHGTDTDGTYRFYLQMDNVKSFESFSVKMNTDDDKWQISTVTVYQVSKPGRRMVAQWLENPIVYSSVIERASNGIEYTANEFCFDKVISRDPLGTVNTCASSSDSALIHNGDTVIIPFKNTDIRKDTNTGGLDHDKKEMTYEEIAKDWGVAKSKNVYNIEVSVANDAVTDYSMGDCGSENYFYFQLLFKNGQKSGIVLANQQIEGDAFRAGETVAFSIACNKDMGELEKVRIIPDDSSSKSDIFDKLKINDIVVTKKSYEGISSSWTISNVGWIDINYYDEIMKDQPHSLDEVARDFSVTEHGYSVTMEFQISTLAAESGSPFSGKATATINYLDGNNKTRQKNVDIADALYAYNEDQNRRVGANKEGVITNPDTMFRPGKTDRFEVEFKDISRLNSIEFHLRGENDGMSWRVGSVSAYIVAKEGILRMNTQGEYEKASTKSLIATNKTTLPYTVMDINSKQARIYAVSFHPNHISIDDEGFVIDPTYAVSANDKMNVYVQMKTESASTLTNTLQAEIQYEAVESGKIKKSLATLIPTEDGKAAYIKDMDASYISTVKNVCIYGVGDGTSLLPVDYVIVQQTRASDYSEYRTVVNNYYYTCSGMDAAMPGGATGTLSNQENLRQQYEAYVSFAAGLDPVTLISDKTDIAASLIYTSICDPNGTEYVSEPVMFTNQDIHEIASGKTVMVKMDVPGSANVKGMILRSIGNVTANAESIYVNAFQVDNDKPIFGKAVSMAAERQILPDGTAWTVANDNGSVVPLSIDFVTADENGGGATGTSSPVRLTVGYATETGEVTARTYEDIRMALPEAENFLPGETQNVKLLVPGATSVKYIKIYPYDTMDNITASWKLKSVRIGTMEKGHFVTTNACTVDRYILESEDPYLINMTSNLITVKVSADNGDGTTTKKTLPGEEGAILMEPGTVMTFEINGNSAGAATTLELYEVSGDAKKAMPTSRLGQLAQNIFTFTAPSAEDDKEYMISVVSMEADNVKVDIKIKVLGTGESDKDDDKKEEGNKN